MTAPVLPIILELNMYLYTESSTTRDPAGLSTTEQVAVAYPGIFFGGVQQIQLRTEDRENGDLGAVAP